MKTFFAIGALALVCAAQSSQADVVEYMPSFANVVTVDDPSNPPPADGRWYRDRQAPGGFVGGQDFQGRTNTLKISILGSSQDPRGPFYHLEGREYGFNQNFTSWTLSADLFVENGWASSSNGLRRAEMWGVSLNAAGLGCALPAIGFTNEGSGVGRFRIANGHWTETWFDIGAAVNYGAWNSFKIEFDPTADLFKYYVNGALATSVSSIVPPPGFNPLLGGRSTGLGSVIMQTYNYGQDYMVGWSNVPTPGAAALLGLGGLLAARRRR